MAVSAVSPAPSVTWPILARTAAVWLSITLLAVLAPLHTPLPLLGLCFVGYVVTATIWVRAQYDASLSERGLWVAPPRVALAMVGAGALGIALYAGLRAADLQDDWVLIMGVVLVFLGLGYLTTRGRLGESAAAGRRSLVWLAVAGGLMLLGLVLLSVGLGPVPLGAGLAAVGFLALPVGVSLASEYAIAALTARTDGRRRLLLVLGPVVLAVSALVATLRVDTWWMLVAFVVVSAGVVAVSSSTQADIAVVLAAIALLGVTAVQEPEPPAGLSANGGGERVLVVLGDSYISGEGAEMYFEGTDGDDGARGEADHCRRAPTSWAYRAAQGPAYDALVFLACSGARTFHVVRDPDPGSSEPGEPQPQPGEPGTQLNQYDELVAAADGPLTPALVVLSLGGNDAGFSSIGLTCLAPGDCGDKDLWTPNLDEVEEGLRATFQQVDETFPGVPVVVTAYPDPIDNTDADGCDQVALSRGDREFVSSFLGSLNARVESAALGAGFYYLGEMEQALSAAHLQLCDEANRGRPGLNFIGLQSVGGLAEQRFNPTNWIHNSLHPNERGHVAMLTVFEKWSAAHPAPVDPNPEATRAAAPADAAAPDEYADVESAAPPCTLANVTGQEPSCRAEGTKWALQQVARALLVPGLWAPLYLGGALGAWMFAVAGFAAHRRRRLLPAADVD